MELNLDNYETYLLLYIDNELTANERAAVESFLESNPNCKKEWIDLQKIQLTPEKISYSEKSMLYRFEEMNAQLEPSFKKTLYKNSPITATIIGIKKTYWAYASVAATLIVLFFGAQQFIEPTNTISAIRENGTTMAIKVLQPIKPPFEVKRKTSITITNLDKTHKTLQNQQNIVAESTGKSIPETTIASNQVETVKQDAIESDRIDPINLENNSSLATETKTDKEIFEQINTEDNERIIHFNNLEIDGDKFRGITRRIGAIFKRNKTEKNK